MSPWHVNKIKGGMAIKGEEGVFFSAGSNYDAVTVITAPLSSAKIDFKIIRFVRSKRKKEGRITPTWVPFLKDRER